jgi:hypothetical protein
MATTDYQIGRHQKTGKYHAMMGPGAAVCAHGGRGLSMSLRPATAKEVQTAAPAMFCTKCFSYAPFLDRLKSNLVGGAA